MKYATLVLGLGLLLANIAAAKAGDDETFKCPSGVQIVWVVPGEWAQSQGFKPGFLIKGKDKKLKDIQESDVRLVQRDDGHDVLYYRGRKCTLDPYAD